MDELTGDDYAIILESLAYTKKAFSEYQGYPSEGFRRDKIAEVDAVIKKVRNMRGR